DQAEDGGAQADADRKRHHSEQRESWRLQQLPEHKPKVCRHGCASPILCLGRLRHYLISSSVEAGESLLSLSQSDQHFWIDVDHPYTYEPCRVEGNSTSISPPRGAVATRTSRCACSCSATSAASRSASADRWPSARFSASTSTPSMPSCSASSRARWAQTTRSAFT